MKAVGDRVNYTIGDLDKNVSSLNETFEQQVKLLREELNLE